MGRATVQSPERPKGQYPLVANSNSAIFQFRLNQYTWALIVFGVVLLVSALNMIFIRESLPDLPESHTGFGWVSRAVLCLFATIIVANMIAVFCQEGLRWTLPDNPTRYELFYDLTASNHTP